MADTRIKAGQFYGVIGHGTDGYFLMTNADGSMSWSQASTGPSVTSVTYPGDDTAADPAGDQTVILTGTNFGSSMTVSIGGTTAPSVAHDSSTQLTITTPAKAAGDYDIVVTNTVTGASGTFVNGISYNGVPTWITATGSLGTFESETTISTITLQATEPDGGTITFNITNGALPTGLSLTGANIDGTTTAESSTTLYSFTIEAIDDENQSTPRNFSITVNSAAITPSENFTINTYTGNGSTQSIEGKIGTAAALKDYTSYIQTALPSNSIYALSFWLYFESGVTQYTPFGTDVSSGAGDIVTELGTNGSFSITIQNKARSLSAGALGSTGWKHIAYSSDQTLYINGVNQTGGTTVTNSNPSANLLIGGWRYPVPTWGGFNSKLDQIRVFNRNLTSSEVTTLYNEPSNPSTASTTDIFDDGSGIALYEFEEGAKDTGGVNGYIGAGGVFDGSSSIITGVKKLAIGESISAWFKPSSATVRIYSIYDSTYDFLSISVRYSSGTYKVRIFLANALSNYNYQETATFSLTDDWHHIVVNLNNVNDYEVFIDGSEKAISTYDSAGSVSSIPSDNTMLGVTYTNGVTGYSTQILDQVRFFNRTLDETTNGEVTTLYQETSASATKSTTDIFDDGSGIALYELEGNANDSGIDYGTSAIDSGQSAVFNGSSSKISTSVIPLTNTSFTISSWVNKNDISTGMVFAQGNTSDNNPIISLGFTSSNQIELVNRNNSAIGLVTYITDSTHGMTQTGQWYHLAVVFTTTTYNLYVNGSSVATGSFTANTGIFNTQNIGVRQRATYDGYLNGKIDQVRIYSSALSESDVQALVSETNVPTSNLVAHYKLDGNANDETGTYNGTASNITYTNPAEKPGLIRAYNGTATNVSYAYDGTPTNVSFVGTSFQPDLIWFKNRTDVVGHRIYDSARGVPYYLDSSSTAASADAGAAGLTAFNSNGFSVGSGNAHNGSGDNIVAWMWKAGGTAVSNTDGSITSQVSANPDAGFSIVSFTAPSTEQNFTIGHGLTQKPDMVILKSRDGGAWFVWHKDLSQESYYLYLQDLLAESGLTQDTRIWGQQSFTDTVISARSNYTVLNNHNCIAYCFHSVAGYQKVGSYTGTTAAKQVDVGFQPRFVIIKCSTLAERWMIADSARTGTYSPILHSDLDAAETQGANENITFNSNGFSVPDSATANANINNNGDTYIYLAIA